MLNSDSAESLVLSDIAVKVTRSLFAGDIKQIPFGHHIEYSRALVMDAFETHESAVAWFEEHGCGLVLISPEMYVVNVGQKLGPARS